MSRLSRRKLLAGAANGTVALSSVLNASSHDRAPNGQAQTLPDPVVASVEAWMSDYSKREAMMLEWQDWEVALCERIRPLGIGLTRGHRSRLPEARSMRALDRKIKALGKKLDKRAARIILTRVTSTKAALAKIEMGMRIQGPYDWEDYAFALIQDGCEQLRKWL